MEHYDGPAFFRRQGRSSNIDENSAKKVQMFLLHLLLRKLVINLKEEILDVKELLCEQAQLWTVIEHVHFALHMYHLHLLSLLTRMTKKNIVS